VTNTGTGNNVLATSPTLVTPVLGAASATSVTVDAGAVGTPSITTTGDTNTGIFFPAADTIAFAEGGAEAMRIDSSGNVGIGTSSPTNYANQRTLAVNGTNYGRIDLMAGGTVYGSLYGGTAGPTLASSGALPVLFETNGTERMRILSTGNILSLSGGSTTATGTGITFPATQSASSDANTLDDYEEGTWTPSLGGTATYTTQSGSYIKIGRMVTVKGTFAVLLIGTGSNNSISGLPFTCNSLYGLPVGYFDTINTSVISLSTRTIASSTTLVMTGVASASTAITDSFNTFKNSTYVEFSGTYFTT
jgi:hypothetical protein